MSTPILVLNSGSSSLKFAIIDPDTAAACLTGLAERLGTPEASLRFRWHHRNDAVTTSHPMADHRQVIARVLEIIRQEASEVVELKGVGHRVVHGGEAFTQSVAITAEVIASIRECSQLAPLHNPANLLGIEAISEQLPEIAQVAVFDTSFHQTLPARAYLYALPYELYEQHGLRRYGFHGTSHRYVAEKAATLLNRPLAEINLITVHLGNGCSAAAIRHGQSVDTTMGLTPLEGLVMGTRSGDVDPGLLLHLVETLGYSEAQVSRMLNKQSGLLGLSGTSNDMRTLIESADAGDSRAALAIEVFCYRLAKAIAGLSVAAQPLDAVVFTGGIGENSALIREKVCAQLGFLGLEIDPDSNPGHGKQSAGAISTPGSRRILVIPTNEELMIARDTQRILQQTDT